MSGTYAVTVERQDGRRYTVRGALPLHRARAWARDLAADPGVRQVEIHGPAGLVWAAEMGNRLDEIPIGGH